MKDLSQNNTEFILMHFGVKGQRWGVRKNKIPTKAERNAAVYNTTKNSMRDYRRAATAATGILTYGLAKTLGFNTAERIALTAVGTTFVNGSMKIIGAQTLAELKA